ncbi:CHAT domain-containing protein [Nocardioides ganghwensis]|uniref:CHAT domain-containing protein n=1 Tax=Nocardioides ganghwensis TaxID=252230 RepID=A0A4Q2SCQ3_9ACTN|nr:CHAT domain-containing protein [Nocardioides ganghwensis]MBD3944270.1 CHAT domain-containing protein [Nocardioides ganghwensis]RYC00042.1 CHAT domain-containing protein [Nocardioides ganghwensis]
MVERLTVRGEILPADPGAREDAVATVLDDIGYRVVTRVNTTVAARSGGQEIELEVDEGHFLEITDTNGVTTFWTAESARDEARSRGGRLDLAVPSVTRGTGTAIREVVQSTIDSDLAGLGRGVADWGLDMLLQPAARATVRALTGRLDRPSTSPDRGHPRVRGVHRVGHDLRLGPDSLVQDLDAAGDPFLVLLHGTFSNTEASFGGLLARDHTDWDAMLGSYDDRLVALEHPTLGLTPVENAVVLAQALPEGARVHMLSHSRGGLVGEVLSCAAQGAPSTQAYDRRKQETHPDVAAWAELTELVQGKGIRVERFVRVACPARGTILASRKVDKWASYFFNALKLVPGLDAAGVLSVVKKVVLVLLEQRLDVRAVPGLECMVPESALVATLAGVEHPVADGLFAVKGDLESKGLLGKIALALPTLFFEGDHDLVVNTSAMDGGMPRADMRAELFRSSDHTHFGYFRTPSSREAIRTALVPTETVPGPRGARGAVPAAAEDRPAPSSRRRGDAVHGPTLVIVPDLMGSVLHSASEAERTIWPAPGAIARRGVTSVLTPDPVDDDDVPGLVEPTPDVLVSPYDDLVEVMRHTFVVRAFPYDWRLPLSDSAAQLRAALTGLSESVDGEPGNAADCLVLGHGVGALLALEACAGTGLRPVLLDPPFEERRGMARRAAGQDDLTRTLALVDGETEPRAVGEQLAALEAFRVRSEGLSLIHPWEVEPPLFVCVHDNVHAGHGHLTLPCQHYLSRAPAGSILTSPEVLQDLRRLVQGRSPVGLVAGQPSASPPAPAPHPEPERELLFPTADELARMALGIRTVPGPQPVSLLVRVTHGDLRVGDGPWIVGAQDGTPIGGAEKALDQRLDGALSTHRILGQYPGPAGTLQLFTGPDLEGAAAAVIGLGAPGEVTPGQLTTGVTQAVLRLAAANVHVGPVARQAHLQEHRGFEISCVLAGTVGSGALPIETAVNAVITGVRRANRKLRDLQQTPDDNRPDAWASPPVVGSLQLIELYEDRAVLALQAATNLAQSDGSTDEDVLQVVTALQVGVGGRKGSTAGYLDDRWRTIKVTASASATLLEPGEAPPQPPAADDDLVQLTFTEVGRSAGAETTVTSAQRRVIDQVIRTSIQGDIEPARQTHNTLYELLVPLHMKGQGRPSDNIMFILDAHAASLPLEMLATRSYDDTIVPLAAEVGIIRRLETSTFRQWVRPASGSRALVIGDPRARGWPPLPGARLEANRVAASLEAHGYEVERQISASDDDDSVCTTSILDALFAHDYRIIHLAAHGDTTGRPGVIIGEHDRLTALEIQQLQTTPDLVFLNCCHLATALAPMAPGQPALPWERRDWRPDRFAAGISRQLIDNGVRAVVAAGWAVADDAAATFAGTFYDEFLSGRDLGPATLTARKVVLKEHRNTSTWGAYQVYGPPAMKIQGLPPATRELDLTNPKAVREWLDSLARQSSRLPADPDLRARAVKRITADLEAALSGAPQAWIDGEVQQTVGEVWRNLGSYARAISSFQDALETWSSVAALNVVDQLVSAYVRLGAEHARKSQKTAAERSFAKAERVIRTMNGLGRPVRDDEAVTQAPERLKLTANFELHRLWIDPEDPAALARAHLAFERATTAYERARRQDRYCRLGEVTLRWLRQQRDGTVAGTTEQDLDTVTELLRNARRERWSPKPFAQLAAADCLLVDALLRTPVGRQPTAKELAAFTSGVFDLTDAYRDAFRKGVSERERASVTDYLELLQRLLPPGHLAREQLLVVVTDELR